MKNLLNQVINGSCFNILPQIEKESVDLVVADPPYYQIVKDEWDNQWQTETDYLEWCQKWTQEIYRILKPTGSFYVFGGIGGKGNSAFLKYILETEKLFIRDNWITWDKKRGFGMRKGWMFTREELVHFVKGKNFTFNKVFMKEKRKDKNPVPYRKSKGKAYYYQGGSFMTGRNVWSDITPVTAYTKKYGYTGHIAQKPEELVERIIASSSNPGDLVLDPFLGSGTTAVSAKKLGRNFIGIEINKEYCDISEKRLNKVVIG